MNPMLPDNPRVESSTTALIAPGVRICGFVELEGPGTIEIDGRVEGKIVANHGSVTVRPGGTVIGSVIAQSITIEGAVCSGEDAEEGDDSNAITAHERLHIAASGRAKAGRILYGSGIQMDYGSSIDGALSRMASQEPAKPSAIVIDLPSPAQPALAQQPLAGHSIDPLVDGDHADAHVALAAAG